MKRKDAFRKLRTICERLDQVDPLEFWIEPQRLYLNRYRFILVMITMAGNNVAGMFPYPSFQHQFITLQCSFPGTFVLT